MHPHTVASLGALTGPQRGPQGGRVAESAGSQLETDQRGEGLLRRTADGTAAAYGLLQLGGRGHPLLGGLADDLVDPALHECQRDLQPLESSLLRRRLVEVEESTLQGGLHRHRVHRVELAELVLHAGDVDLDAAAVVSHRADQVLAQPRDAGEQSLVSGLAQCEVEEDVVGADVQFAGELLDVGGEQGRLAVRAEGETDVGGAEYVAGQPTQGLTDLRRDHGAGHLPKHADQRTGHRSRFLRQRVAQGVDGRARQRLDQPLPHVGGLHDPLGPAPSRCRGDTRGKVRGLVEPVVREAHGVRDRVTLSLRGRRIGRLSGGLAGHVGDDRPVDRAVVRLHEGLHLAHQATEIRHAGAARSEAATEGTEGTEDLLEGCALEGVLLIRCVAGAVAHAPHVTHRLPALAGSQCLPRLSP